MLLYFLKGALVSAGLIVAIGSQNAFLLKQALLRNHVFVICLICFLCDVVLMSAGVFGVGQLIGKSKILTIGLGIAGSAFLFFSFMVLRPSTKASGLPRVCSLGRWGNRPILP